MSRSDQKVDQYLPYTNYKDLRLRKPRSDFQVGNVEAWVAGILELPAEAVQLILPGGERAQPDKTLGVLREDWNRHQCREPRQ